MNFQFFLNLKHKLTEVVEAVLTAFSVTLTYFLGIGFSSLTAKLFGTTFLKKKFESSSWSPVEKKELKLKKMY